MWSDYEYKLCACCGHKSYHERGASRCRDCQIVDWDAAVENGRHLSPFVRRAMAGELPAKVTR